MAAYKAKDFKAAIPLLKEWAETPEVARDTKKRTEVLQMVVESQKQLGIYEGYKPAATGVATTGSATQGVASGTQATRPAETQVAGTVKTLEKWLMNGDATARRIPHVPMKEGEVREFTIKGLGNFEFDPTRDAEVPPDVQALHGAKVKLRGFMLPLNQADRVTDFALMPTLGACCFGEAPGTQHVVTCRIPKARSLQYVSDEVVVEGVLTVKVKREDDYSYSIFELDVTSVRVAE
jgi:hypothetical protein